jgi:hypothetical protein
MAGANSETARAWIEAGKQGSLSYAAGFRSALPSVSDAFDAMGPLITASFQEIKGHLGKMKIVFSSALKETRDEIKLREAEIHNALANPRRMANERKILKDGMEQATRDMVRARKHHNAEAYALARAEYLYLKGKVDAINALKASIDVQWKIDDVNKKIAGISVGGIPLHLPKGFFKIPQLAGGLGYVPYDGMLAQLHEGERVLTKAENKGWGGTRTLNVNVTSTDGSMHRSGMSTRDLANAIRRWED